MVFLTAGAAVDGYDQFRHPVSSLVLADIGWVQTASFLLTGGLLLAFSVGLQTSWRRRGGGAWLPRLVALFGVAFVGAGVFPTDPVGGFPPGTPPTPEPTPGGALHTVSSAGFFLGFPVAGVSAARSYAEAGRRSWATFTAIATSVYLPLFVVSLVALAQLDPVAGVGGLSQRLAIAVALGWLAAAAGERLQATPRP